MLAGTVGRNYFVAIKVLDSLCHFLLSLETRSQYTLQ